MNALMINSETEWIDMQEAAQIRGVSSSAISHALKKHQEIKVKYTRRFGRKMYITKEGFTILFNVQNVPRQTLNKDESGLIDRSQVRSQVKQKIAEMAVANLNDPIIAMRLEQIRMQEQLSDLQAFKDKWEPLLADTEPVGLTIGQRPLLVERVRRFCKQTEYPYERAWKVLHEHVGRKDLDHYKFTDYPKATQLLKQFYKQNNLEW